MSASPRKRTRVTAGSVTIPIYYTPTRATVRGASTLYDAWTASWRTHDGRRRRLKQSDYDLLIEKLEPIASELSQYGEHAVVTPERRAHLALLDQVARELQLDPLTLLTSAKQLILEQRARAARSDRHVSVRETLDELLRDCTRRGVSKFYIRDLTVRLTPFADTFRCSITALTGPDIATWLRSLHIGPRTFNNYRSAVHALTQFAKQQHYLPRDWSELDAVQTIKLKKAHRILIFTPDEIQTLLSAATDRIRPFLLLGAFAGIRHEEIKRLTWANIRPDKGYIILPRETTKTERKRMPPILPNLRERLLYYSGCHGPVCTYQKPDQAAAKLAKRCGLKWKRNALRHSFISYRVATVQSVDQVALEAGNSAQEIHDHYLELVTQEESDKCFGICPKNHTNGLLELKFALN
jgi:integrase